VQANTNIALNSIPSVACGTLVTAGKGTTGTFAEETGVLQDRTFFWICFLGLALGTMVLLICVFVRQVVEGVKTNYTPQIFWEIEQ
jgi:hypothetical protein